MAPAFWFVLFAIGGCAVFPRDNVWNARVDRLPIDANSATYVATIGVDKPLVPDFDIPFVVVSDPPRVPIVFTDYGDESDPGPYPVPLEHSD